MVLFVAHCEFIPLQVSEDAQFGMHQIPSLDSMATTDKLQWVLLAKARAVSVTNKFDYGLSWLLHTELHRLDVPERVTYKLSIMIYIVQLHAWPSSTVPDVFLPPLHHGNKFDQLSTTAQWAFSAVGLQCGILCRTTCAILLLAETHLDNIWKRLCSLCTSACSALEVSRLCAI